MGTGAATSIMLTDGKSAMQRVLQQAFGASMHGLDFKGSRSHTEVTVMLAHPGSQVYTQELMRKVTHDVYSALLCLGSSVQWLKPSYDTGRLYLEYLDSPTEVCWEFVKHGRCPRPGCRWAHTAVEVFFITVSLKMMAPLRALPPDGTNYMPHTQMPQLACHGIPMVHGVADPFSCQQMGQLDWQQEAPQEWQEAPQLAIQSNNLFETTSDALLVSPPCVVDGMLPCQDAGTIDNGTMVPQQVFPRTPSPPSPRSTMALPTMSIKTDGLAVNTMFCGTGLPCTLPST